MRRIDLSKQALEFLRYAPIKPAKQIAAKLKLLSEDAASLPTEALKGYAPLRRLKSGEFRIVYSLEPDVIRIVLIGKRNDDEIYRELARAWRR